MTDTTEDGSRHWWPPSWFTMTILGATMLGAITIAFVSYEIRDARAENRIRCERSVNTRYDTRAMWLELFDAFPDAATETGLRDDLETLLPPLRCEDNIPVIDTGETND